MRTQLILKGHVKFQTDFVLYAVQIWGHCLACKQMDALWWNQDAFGFESWMRHELPEIFMVLFILLNECRLVSRSIQPLFLSSPLQFINRSYKQLSNNVLENEQLTPWRHNPQVITVLTRDRHRSLSWANSMNSIRKYFRVPLWFMIRLCILSSIHTAVLRVISLFFSRFRSYGSIVRKVFITTSIRNYIKYMSLYIPLRSCS
jgi:hypothetical protein